MGMNRFAILSLTVILAACSNQPSGVRLTHDQPTAAPVISAPRTEPVFYNGKVYQVTLVPEQGGYAFNISGMSAQQQKDAVNLATSALHHFACKDSQKAHFVSQPSYVSSQWQFHGNCG
jgi:hypothetical protein